MISLESIKDYITGLNFKETIQVIGVYLIIFIGIIIFFIMRHVNLLSDAEQKMKALNKARQEIQAVLKEYEHIKNKKNEVDQLLLKDKSFYIQKYYQDTIQSLNISTQSTSNLVSQAGPAGYIEESLQINLSTVTMKQLCEFLQALQTTPRVFVKNLDISKAPDKKINVSISIATLKPALEKVNNSR
jgi:type II secretory pathway component PulM